jgi:membrane protein implicated in regulation of membrane protease activity
VDPWVWWVIAAVLLVIIEVTTLDLVFVMLAGGALAGAAVTVAGGPAVLAIAAAIVIAVALLGVVRPVALRHLRHPPEIRTGVAALVGARGVVIERVDAHSGRIKLGGEVWSAKSYDDTQVIEPGSTVDVIEIKGATALVYESEAPWKV